MAEEIGFWVAVGVVAIVAVALFKLTAAKVGDKVPGMADLAAFI